MPVIPRHYIPFTAGDFLAAFRQLMSGQFIDGDAGGDFAREFAAYIGTAAAFPVASARAGLCLACKALALRPGDEVLVPACYFFTTPLSIRMAQAEAVVRFVPVDPDTGNIDPAKLLQHISPQTRAIIVQHTFGRACAMDDLLRLREKHGLALIEDCAQAAGSEYHGRKLGSFGEAAVFSFARGKNMTCGGGGMITTGNRAVIDFLNTTVLIPPSRTAEIKALISTALQALLTRRPWYTISVFPLLYLLNRFSRDRLEQLFREDEAAGSASAPAAFTALANWRAAVGRRQLRKLDRLNRVRHAHAQKLLTGLQQCPGLKLPADEPASFNGYYAVPVRARQLFVLARRLMLRGVDMRLDYMKYAGAGQPRGEQAGYLPNHPGLHAREIETLIAILRDVAGRA